METDRQGDRIETDRQGDRIETGRQGDKIETDRQGDRTEADRFGDRTETDRLGDRTETDKQIDIIQTDITQSGWVTDNDTNTDLQFFLRSDIKDVNFLCLVQGDQSAGVHPLRQKVNSTHLTDCTHTEHHTSH